MMDSTMDDPNNTESDDNMQPVSAEREPEQDFEAGYQEAEDEPKPVVVPVPKEKTVEQQPRKKKAKRTKTSAEDRVNGYTLSADDPEIAPILEQNGSEWLSEVGLSLNDKGEIRFLEGQALARTENERVTVISKLSGKKLAGTAAPLAKNLLIWLEAHKAYAACTPEQRKKRSTTRKTKQKRGPAARLSDAKRRVKRGDELLGLGRNADAFKCFSDAIVSVKKILSETEKREAGLDSEIASLGALLNRPKSPTALALLQLTAQVTGQP